MALCSNPDLAFSLVAGRYEGLVREAREARRGLAAREGALAERERSVSRREDAMNDLQDRVCGAEEESAHLLRVLAYLGFFRDEDGSLVLEGAGGAGVRCWRVRGEGASRVEHSPVVYKGYGLVRSVLVTPGDREDETSVSVSLPGGGGRMRIAGRELPLRVLRGGGRMPKGVARRVLGLLAGGGGPLSA